MERIRVQAGQLCRGWQAEGVREIVRDNLDEIVVPHLYAEARGLVSGHREAGRDVIVVSASGHEVVDPIAALLGADTVIATQMVIADGRYTGDFAFYAYGEAKAVRIGRLAAERGYELADSYAYSYSITICRCSRRWVTPPRSNPTGRCGGPRSSGASRYCPASPPGGPRVPG
jgi:HAD superfamily hydrolase (TIGR01490 family)